ncbi:MAG: hypothetical protein Q8R28_01895 [Dehalococcoidia bacterium]|nr:hypothetical protein [Dehalococcoidia bacterium]
MATKAKTAGTTKHTCQGISEKTSKPCGKRVAQEGGFCATHARQSGHLATVKYGTRSQRLLVGGLTIKQLREVVKTSLAGWKVDPKTKAFVRGRGGKDATERTDNYRIKADDEVQFHRPAGRLGSA